MLHIAEYVVINSGIQRLKYRYHLQSLDGSFVRRWDNAPHYPDLATFPDHCHLASGEVIPSPATDIPSVLLALVPLLETKS